MSKITLAAVLLFAPVVMLATAIIPALDSPSDSDETQIRGYELYRSGSYEQAIAAFDEVIAAEPERGLAYGFRGVSRWELARAAGDRALVEEAIADLDRAIALDRSLFVAFFHRGQAHRWLGNYPQAITDFELALGLSDVPTQRVQLAYWRGLAKVELGDVESAREAFEAARLLVKDSELRTRILAALEALDSSN
jgi:tetratricopeptide (TPR) repeat protein